MMKSIKVIILGAVLALAGFVGVVVSGTSASAETRECGDNAIVRCGVMSASELKSKYADNARGLKKIYSYYDIDSSDITASGSAKLGYVHTNGNVTVDGKVVATNAKTVGRSGSLGGSKVKITDTLYVYQGPDRLKSTLSAYVFFNADGTFKSAVLRVCGNPVTAKPKKPVYACSTLTANQVDRTKFEFKTTATASNGATIKDYVYTFGDGSTATNGATTTHTYAKEGTYNVAVKVRVNVNDKIVPVTSETCTAQVTVKPADKPAITITKTVNDVEHITAKVGETFTYKIVVKNIGNVDLKDAVVTDTAPSQVTLLSASAGNISGYTWTYTIPTLAVGESKSFTITAKYAEYASGTHKNTVCVDTPTIPETNPDACDDASTDTYKTSTPKELPHTGIADVLGGGLGLGGIVGASWYYIASRRMLR